MTNQEFSNEFDTLLSSYTETDSFGNTSNPINARFDEYEKSVFLTNAQIALVRELYGGIGSQNTSFEDTEELRRYLSNLINTKSITSQLYSSDYTGVSNDSVFYQLPDRLMYITYEAAKVSGSDICNSDEYLSVVPVTQDEYYRISNNPFREPNRRRVLRLDMANGIVELVPGKGRDVDEYLVRYVERPQPIILSTLPDGLKIDGTSTVTQCSLDPAIHRIILEAAVKQAYASKMLTATQTKGQ